MKYASLISALLLLIGCFSLPIGYYTFLRIFVFIACVLLIWKDWEKGLNLSNIAFGIIAILFNPIIPVYMHDKELWAILDAICAIAFLIRTYRLHKEEAV